MSSLTVFQFHSHTVRSILDEQGEPWFVAADVCKALELASHKGSYKHHLEKLDEDERMTMPRALAYGDPTLNMGVVMQKFVEVAGGAVWAEPQVWLISESAVYTLILRSREATTPGTVQHQFKRWVTHDVLPALRKTGAYMVHPTLVDVQKQVRQSRTLADNLETRVAALIGVQRMIAAVPGVKASMAAAVALNVIEMETGMRMDAFRAALPRNSEPLATLNSTGLGALIHEPAVTTNRLLERLGLQKRNARGDWELTEAGMRHGEAYPYTNGRHSGYQILWKPSVAVILRDPQFNLYIQ